MKQLWDHVLCCRDNTCAYVRCVSSRYLLNHFQYCDHEATRCPVCIPVRADMRRRELQRQMDVRDDNDDDNDDDDEEVVVVNNEEKEVVAILLSMHLVVAEDARGER